MKRLHPSLDRSGFTLVELLVVMALIVMLATLMIGFFPSVATSAREARAATLLQSWLNIAKQRALRDQTPTGLRLLITPGAPTEVIECQYISQPEDFCAGRVRSELIPTPLDKVFFDFSSTPSVDLVNGYTMAEKPFHAVQKGDFLEVSGTGVMHRIESVDSKNQATIMPALPNRITTASTFRIVRGSRTLGDEPLKLPENTIIDIGTNVQFPPFLNPLPFDSTSQYVDILFAPSGQVISRGLTTDKIHLWVRVPNPDNLVDPFRGDPTLVSIFASTGFVGAYSPDPMKPGNNPYGLVK